MVCFGRHGDACNKCTRKCLSMHQTQKNSSPIVTRFFKVLYDNNKENLSELLYLPPDFAATVGNLLEEETYLEDSSGKRWTVTLSNVNDSLAFKKGWKEFFLSHGLKIGQFLEFHYIMGSHFVVHIFETSALEITDFNSREIIDTVDEEIAAQDEPNQKCEVNLINKHITRRGRKKKKLRNKGIKTAQLEKATHVRTDTGVQSELQDGLVNIPVVYAENLSCNTSSKGYDVRTNKDNEDKIGMSNEVSKFQDGERRNPVLDAEKQPTTQTKSGEKSSATVKDTENTRKSVSVDAKIPCFAVVQGQHFLELLSDMPSVSGKNNRKSLMVVLLRLSNKRLWPVTYQEIYGVKALVDGWKGFYKENSICPGDVCCFQLEDSSQCIWRVDIIRN